MPFTFLTAAWRKLIMAQYEVPPVVLAPWLPAGLELDFYQPTPGSRPRCFVSLVGFLFDNVRLVGIPVPFHRRFEEVNLRMYVRRRQPDGTFRRGVIFLSEIVPRPAITAVARALYGEAYSTAPTAHRWQRAADGLEVTYEWRHRRLWQSLAVRADAKPRAIDPGSLEEFITEHYWGYTARRTRAQASRRGDSSAPPQGTPAGQGTDAAHPGHTTQYGVAHPRWLCYPIREYRIAADFGSLYGPVFAPLTGRAPDHILLAEGSPIRIFWGGQLT